jgi:phosphoglycerol geranylgeranyltransferase
MKKKLFAVLIDPDKFNAGVVQESNLHQVDFLLVGGSGLRKDAFHKCIRSIKKLSNLPLIIFPGGHEQISNQADALLLLSLLSGRNADYLIGEHVKAAHQLKKSKLEIIPTGYILIGGGENISTQKITQTKPIGRGNIALSVATALAGELLGMKMIYLEAGSGNKRPVDARVIASVKKNSTLPLMVGGGIHSAKQAVEVCKAGADVIVVGNAIEKEITLIKQLSNALS